MTRLRSDIRSIAALVVLCLVTRSCHCARRRLAQAAVTDTAPQFPRFQLPTVVQNAANNVAQNAVPLTKANSGPLLGEKVFSSNLPVSAVNLGLGANAFPGERKNDLASTVEANVTLFKQQTFQDKCAQSQLCMNITDTIWQSLLDNLLSYGQGSADTTRTGDAVDAVNTTYYIVQPGGVSQVPSDVQASIESMTPSPTPDPSSEIMSKVDEVSSKVDGAVQKLTGFRPSPGGFSGVLQRFFGDSKTTSGAAAAVAGAAVG